MDKRFRLLIVLTILVVEAVSQNVKRDIKRAENEFTRGNYRGAISNSTKVLGIDSLNLDALFIKGYSYYYLQNPDSAYHNLMSYSTIKLSNLESDKSSNFSYYGISRFT